eukprot:14922450-Alexandrium_andersonii.AAC.1
MASRRPCQPRSASCLTLETASRRHSAPALFIYLPSSFFVCLRPIGSSLLGSALVVAIYPYHAVFDPAFRRKPYTVFNDVSSAPTI